MKTSRQIYLMLEALPYEEHGTDLDELTQLLKRFGITVTSSLDGENGHRSISFSWNADEVQNKISRGAGRPLKFSNKSLHYSDIQAMLEQNSPATVAAEIGMSRATLYRKLRKFEENPWMIEEDEYF